MVFYCVVLPQFSPLTKGSSRRIIKPYHELTIDGWFYSWSRRCHVQQRFKSNFSHVMDHFSAMYVLVERIVPN